MLSYCYIFTIILNPPHPPCTHTHFYLLHHKINPDSSQLLSKKWKHLPSHHVHQGALGPPVTCLLRPAHSSSNDLTYPWSRPWPISDAHSPDHPRLCQFLEWLQISLSFLSTFYVVVQLSTLRVSLSLLYHVTCHLASLVNFSPPHNIMPVVGHKADDVKWMASMFELLHIDSIGPHALEIPCDIL